MVSIHVADSGDYAALFGVTTRTGQRWIRTHAEHGDEGFLAGARSPTGRPLVTFARLAAEAERRGIPAPDPDTVGRIERFAEAWAATVDQAPTGEWRARLESSHLATELAQRELADERLANAYNEITRLRAEVTRLRAKVNHLAAAVAEPADAP